MVYRLEIEFEDLCDLLEKLEKLVNELRSVCSTRSREELKEISILFDETVKKVGSIARRIAEDMGMRIKVYEASSSIDNEIEVEGITMVPAKDDLDVLRWAKKLDAILITGDKRLAQTAEAYGVKAIYMPPSGVVSKEHYVLEALKKVKEMVEGSRSI